MRLINCKTMQLEEYFEKNIPPYAILSHTWGDDEVTFLDLPLDNPTTKAKRGYQKIYYTCRQAVSDGVKYAWIDTCCIDKRSSSELSEAINSMFAWYRDARYCYAYLSDVQASTIGLQFRKSRWFTRGWTLQELLAPKDVSFYNQQWNKLGQKSRDKDLIANITRIDAPALIGAGAFNRRKNGPFGSYCVAKRMSWASRRETTRTEDMAYCLLGIFDISLPLLYGEGRRAFRRLQEEIIRRVDDDSILAWGLVPDASLSLRTGTDIMEHFLSLPPPKEGILATSPKDFENCGSLERSASSKTPLTLTSVGLTIELPIISFPHSDDDSKPRHILKPFVRIAILSCSMGKSLGLVGIMLNAMKENDSFPTGFSRAQWYIEPHYYSSIVIGFRDAITAVSSMVLIEETDWIPGFPRDNRSYQQVIVNTSENLQNSDFHVREKTYWGGWSTRGVFVDDKQWFPQENILTLGELSSQNVMVGFCFESMREDVDLTFTVFMRPDRSIAIVCEGSVFTDDNYAAFHRYIHQNPSQEHGGSLIVLDSERNGFKIGARIRTVAMHGHEIAELNVYADAVSNFIEA